MIPQVAMRRLDVEDPRMLKWVYIMDHHEGMASKVVCGLVLVCWLRNQLLMIEDYSYKGEDFSEDLELPLLEGEEWDDQGNKDAINYVINF